MSFRAFSLCLIIISLSIYFSPEGWRNIFPALFLLCSLHPSPQTLYLSIWWKEYFLPHFFCSLFPPSILSDRRVVLFSCSFILSSEILSLFGFQPISLFCFVQPLFSFHQVFWFSTYLVVCFVQPLFGFHQVWFFNLFSCLFVQPFFGFARFWFSTYLVVCLSNHSPRLLNNYEEGLCYPISLSFASFFFG